MLARSTSLLLILLAAFLVTACGGDDDAKSDDSKSSSSDSMTKGDDGGDAMADGASLKLSVKGNDLKFEETELTAKAGSVTLKLTNDSTIPHNIAVEDADGKQVGDAGELVTSGESSTTTVDLEPGTYTYYCEPHKSSGMTGTLTVS